MSVANHWIVCQGRTTLDGEDEPGLEMRFHSAWSHRIFGTARGYQVVFGPIGIDIGTYPIGTYPTVDEACAVAEANARTRALNTLQTARQDISRAMAVLGALSCNGDQVEAVES